MTAALNRRGFLAASAALGAGLAMAGRSSAAPEKTILRKALQGDPDEKILAEWKAAGFDGVESLKWQASPREAAAARKKAESLGMRIHSVQFGYGDFIGGAAAVAATLAKMETALRAAQSYGADDVLFIPGRIDVETTPQPGEFQSASTRRMAIWRRSSRATTQSIESTWKPTIGPFDASARASSD